MLQNNINNEKLRETIANWSTNLNQSDTINVIFYETNSTDTMDTNITQAIDLSTYQIPLDPYTKFVYNFSHVFLIWNNDTDTKNE